MGTHNMGSRRDLKCSRILDSMQLWKNWTLNKNLIGKNVLDMLEPKLVTYEMMKMSLEYLMFMKRKRDENIKTKGCADGWPQREYITELESSSPMVKSHTLFLSCLVYVIEDWRKKDCGCWYFRGFPIRRLARWCTQLLHLIWRSDDRYVVPNQTQEQETDLCWYSKQKNGKINQ